MQWRLLFSVSCFVLAGAAWGQDAPPLTLPEAITAALANSPAAHAAQQQLMQAQARVIQAQAQRRFQITFNSTVSGSNGSVIQPPPSSESFGTLQNTLTVPLPLGAKPRLAITQAQAQFDAARAQYDAARLTLAGQVGAAYYDLLRKQALRQVAQDTAGTAQRELADAQKRSQAGDVPQLDVLRAQGPLANAQAGLVGAENDVVVAEQTLNGLLARPLDDSIAVADVPASPPGLPYTLEEARALAAHFSPDIRAAEAAIRADEAALALARSYRDPSVSLQASDTRSNDQTGFRRLDAVQASVTIPLNDGGLGAGQIREAEAALGQARAQVQIARQSATQAVSAAYLTAQSSRRQVAAALIARDIAQITYDKTVRGYRNGLFPLTDVLNAQSALVQARIAYTQAIYNAAVAVNSLTTATSGGASGMVPVPATPSPPAGAPAPTNTTNSAAPGVHPNPPGTTPNTSGKGTP